MNKEVLFWWQLKCIKYGVKQRILVKKFLMGEVINKGFDLETFTRQTYLQLSINITVGLKQFNIQ